MMLSCIDLPGMKADCVCDITPLRWSFILSAKYADKILKSQLAVFERASGNEIKRQKSYLIWLGKYRDAPDTVFGIEPLEGSSRYLGVKIAAEFDPSENWKKVLDSIPSCVEHYSTFGLSIFGRVLMANSCLLSKLWFIAHHAPINQTNLARANKMILKYINRNRKLTAIRKDKLFLAPEFGGMGLLEIEKQTDLLLAKWAIRSLAGDPHPWNAFWRNNVAELQRALKITHHPVTIELNWNACKRSHLFHLIVPVYRAFHRLGIRLHCKPSAILAQTPHRNCNFKLDNGKSLPTPRGNRLANKVVREFENLEISLNLNLNNFFVDGDCTHKKSVAQLERHYGVQDMNITLREWTQLTRVPDCVTSLMHIPEKLLWGAMQLHDNSIGDIYLIQYSKGEVENLLWFAPTEDNSYTLRFNGNADPSWGDWRTDIIPILCCNVERNIFPPRL